MHPALFKLLFSFGCNTRPPFVSTLFKSFSQGHFFQFLFYGAKSICLSGLARQLTYKSECTYGVGDDVLYLPCVHRDNAGSSAQIRVMSRSPDEGLLRKHAEIILKC